MYDQISIAGIQADLVWEKIDQNLIKFDQLIDQITDGVDIILLPEMFTTGFSMEPASLAEKMNGKTVTWMLKKAKEKRAVICGSIIIEQEGKYFNRLLWVKPDGKIEQYNKRHLFRLANEQKEYEAGKERKIVDYKGWKFLLNICYDLRFPVWSRNQKDYDVLIFLANWPALRNHAWQTLLLARAIENQAYCLGINRIGKDGKGMDHIGNSAIIDYTGKSLVEKQNKEAIIKYTFEKKDLLEFRQKYPFFMDADQFEIK